MKTAKIRWRSSKPPAVDIVFEIESWRFDASLSAPATMKGMKFGVHNTQFLRLESPGPTQKKRSQRYLCAL